MFVTIYYNILRSLWQELDLLYVLEWSSAEDSAQFQRIMEDSVMEFLACLNDLNEVRGRFLGKEPLPLVTKALTEVRWEESRKGVMMGKYLSNRENSALNLLHQPKKPLQQHTIRDLELRYWRILMKILKPGVIIATGLGTQKKVLEIEWKTSKLEGKKTWRKEWQWNASYNRKPRFLSGINSPSISTKWSIKSNFQVYPPGLRLKELVHSLVP